MGCANECQRVDKSKKSGLKDHTVVETEVFPLHPTWANNTTSFLPNFLAHLGQVA